METHDWRDMLPELLSYIAGSLELLELLGFRIVCKNWKAASLTASAEIGSSTTQPWLLIYGGIDSQCFLLSNTGSGKKYTLGIPEMDEATCIASNEGWLLLRSEDLLFFFCPFSKAIISLPKSPFPEFSDCVAAFSFVPTSPNCMVAVIRRNGNDLELCSVSRGNQEWNMHNFSCLLDHLNKITGAVYYGGLFRFLDSYNGLVTFCAIKGEWKLYTIVPPGCEGDVSGKMEFTRSKNRFSWEGMKEKLGLEGKVSVSTCGTLIPIPDKHDLLIHNENIEAVEGQPESHHLKGVSLQPRYFHITPQQQSW